MVLLGLWILAGTPGCPIVRVSYKETITFNGPDEEAYHLIINHASFFAIEASLRGREHAINEFDEYGDSLLNVAVQYNRKDVVQYLLDHGACVNGHAGHWTSWQGSTPLMNAATHDYYEIAELLLTYGADVDIQSPLGLTANELAEKSPRMLELLNKYRSSTSQPSTHPATQIDTSVKPPWLKALER